MKNISIIVVLSLSMALNAQSIIDISVKGISDAKKDGAQKDRKEAVLDAKKQACDKAGLKLSSKTMVENFKVVYDYVESKAETVLLPGFQIVDVGYTVDGTYQVVLSGKIKTMEDEAISVKDIRYAKSLYERGKYSKSAGILKRYIDTTDEKVSDAAKEEAFYYFIRWGYPLNPRESFEMFSSYYPESKHIDALDTFLKFVEKPLLTVDTTIPLKGDGWKKGSFKKDDVDYDKQLVVCRDTMIIKDFANREHTLVLDYTMYRTGKKVRDPFAYSYTLRYCTGNVRKTPPKSGDGYVEVFSRFKTFPEKNRNKYRASRSDSRFADFKMGDYLLEGGIPSGKETIEQKLKFTISQVAY
jgi:hypothetical protein